VLIAAILTKISAKFHGRANPAARARRFFCFFLKAARLRAVFLLRFFSRMAVSYRLFGAVLGDCPSIIDRPCQGAQPPDQWNLARVT